MTVNQKLPRQGRDDVTTSRGSLRAFLEQTTRSPKTDRPPPDRDDAVHPVAGCPVYDGFNSLPWGSGPKDGGGRAAIGGQVKCWDDHWGWVRIQAAIPSGRR
jgi:hypothetical protein